MAFPSWHYPDSLPLSDYTKSAVLRNVRDPFADYGEHCAINNVDGVWLPQKEHKPGSNDLVAEYPSLPMMPPARMAYDWEDPCMAEALRIRKQWKADYINMKRIIHLMRMKMKTDPNLQLPVDQLRDRLVNNQRPDRKLPAWINTIISRDSYMRGDLPLAYNRSYNGGLLSHIPMNEEGVLCHVGLDQRKILFSRLKFESGRLELTESLTSVHEEPVYELNTALIGDTGYVAIRDERNCHLISVNNDGCLRSKEIWTLKGSECKPTSVCASQCIPGEVVSCWENGDVVLKSENYCDTVIHGRRSRFSVAGSPWFRAHYGSTPRTLLLTDPTAVDITDLRSRRSKEQELFAIPSKYCLNSELIMTSSSHPGNSFYHFVATDYKVFLLDQRMPGYVVLQMHPSLRQPPQYMQILPNPSQNGVDHMIVANQSARETLVYPMTSFNDTTAPPRLPEMPWRVAQIEDLMYQCGVEKSTVKPSIARRLLQSSLLGVCAIKKDEGLSVIQLSSAGDLFNQTYTKRRSRDEDKTSASGLEGKPLADDMVKEYCEEWLEESEKNFLEELTSVPMSRRFEVVDASAMFDAITHNFYPHRRCPICKDSMTDSAHFPESEAEMTGDEAGHGDEVYSDHVSCMQCGLNRKTALKLRDRIKEDRLYTRENKDELIDDLMKIVDAPEPDQFTDPQSRILLKLWNHDYNIDQEIEERFKLLEIERKKRFGEEYKSELPSDSDSGSPPITPQKRLKTNETSNIDESLKIKQKTDESMKIDQRMKVDESLKSKQTLKDESMKSEPESALEATPSTSMVGGRVPRVPGLSSSDMEETISKGVNRLFKYESDQESVIMALEPGSESDFDEAELEMFQMASYPGSFSFNPGSGGF